MNHKIIIRVLVGILVVAGLMFALHTLVNTVHIVNVIKEMHGMR
jgi:hypothetical protein